MLLGLAYPAPTRPGPIIHPPTPPRPEMRCVVGQASWPGQTPRPSRQRHLSPPSSGTAVRSRARLDQSAGRSAFAFPRLPPAGTPELRVAPALEGWKLMDPESSRRNLLTMAALGTKREPPSSGTREKRVGGCARRSRKRSAQFRPFPEHPDSILPPAGGRS